MPTLNDLRNAVDARLGLDDHTRHLVSAENLELVKQRIDAELRNTNVGDHHIEFAAMADRLVQEISKSMGLPKDFVLPLHSTAREVETAQRIREQSADAIARQEDAQALHYLGGLDFGAGDDRTVVTSFHTEPQWDPSPVFELGRTDRHLIAGRATMQGTARSWRERFDAPAANEEGSRVFRRELAGSWEDHGIKAIQHVEIETLSREARLEQVQRLLDKLGSAETLKIEEPSKPLDFSARRLIEIN